MGATVGDGAIVLTTRIDTSELKKGTMTVTTEVTRLSDKYKKAGNEAAELGKKAKGGCGKAKDAVSAVSSALKKLAVQLGITFSISAFAKWSNAAGQMATQTEASTQRLIDIYGEASQAVGKFIDTSANALGMSKASAASFAAVYGNLFSTWADQQTNAALTTQYLKATAVVASKTGRTMEDVQERIRSGLLGNTEAVEDLGIFVNVKTIEMTEAFKKMANGKSWEQLDAYAQSQIRTMAILEQATSKYGDEVANTSSLTRARFKAAYEDFQNTWGQVVNTVLMPVMEWATKALTYLNGVLHGLFGIATETVKQSDNISGSVQNQKDLTDAVKETAKEQKKATAGFDELNILNSGDTENAESASGSGGIGTASLEGITTPSFEVDTTSFQNGIEKGKELKEVFEPLITVFSDLKTAIGLVVAAFGAFVLVKWLLNWLTSIGKAGASTTSIFAGFFDKLGKAAEIIAILGGMALVIDSLSGLITAFSESGLSLGDVAGLLAVTLGTVAAAFSVLMAVLNKMKPNWQTIALAVIVFGGLALVLNQITKLIKVFSKSGRSFGEILGSLAGVLGVVVGVMFSLVGAATLLGTNPMALLAVIVVVAALALVLGTLALTLPPILDAFGEFIAETTPALVRAMTDIGQAIEKIIYALGTTLPSIIREIGNLFNTIFTGICKVLDKTCNSMVSVLVDGFGGAFEKVLDAIISFVTEAGPAVNTFVDNIIEAVTKLINFIISGIEYMVNRLVIDGINGIINGINSVGEYVGFTIPAVPNFEIPRFIPKLAEGAVLPANKPFLAMVGDQKHGTNIEAPLATIQEAVALVMDDQTAAILAGFEASVGIQREILEAVLGIQIGDDVIGKAAARYNRKMATARGGL